MPLAPDEIPLVTTHARMGLRNVTGTDRAVADLHVESSTAVVELSGLQHCFNIVIKHNNIIHRIFVSATSELHMSLICAVGRWFENSIFLFWEHLAINMSGQRC